MVAAPIGAVEATLAVAIGSRKLRLRQSRKSTRKSALSFWCIHTLRVRTHVHPHVALKRGGAASRSACAALGLRLTRYCGKHEVEYF